jgi:sugar O-acyltransferase (sialic acid O-acetyltransferase NeuD family)
MDQKKPVLILGAGTIGKMAYDIFSANDVVVYGFLDDEVEAGTEIDLVSVLGKIDDDHYFDLIGNDCEVFIASDETSLKQNLVDDLKESKKVVPINAIHKDSNISTTCILGYGTMVGKKASLGAFSTIGSHCLIHAHALIEVDTVLGDYVQIGAGSIVNAKVEIGKKAFIGSGVTIVSGVKIGKGAKIGAGSVVISNVPEGKTFFGNPAKEV